MDKEAFDKTIQLARKYQAEGLCGRAEDLYRQAIAQARTARKSALDTTVLIETLAELANFYSFQGKDDLAESLWQEILAIGRNTFTGQNPIFINTIFKLSRFFEKNGHSIKAEALYKELLAKQKNESGHESLEIVAVLKRLAAFYCREQNYLKAESLYLEVLAIEEYHLGTCTETINNTVNALTDIFEKLKKWRLAEYMLNRQKAILTVLHGTNSLCVASCQLRLAELFGKTGQLNKAEQTLHSALQIYIDIFGELASPVIALQKKLDILRTGIEALPAIPTVHAPYNDPYNPILVGHPDLGNTVAVSV